MADRLIPALAALPAATASAFDSAALRARLESSVTPHLDRELWKYTPLAGFLEAAGTAAAAEPELQARTGAKRLTVSRASEQPLALESFEGAERFPLADAALLVAGDCLILDLAAGARAELTIDVGDGMNVPVVLRVHEGARLMLEERVRAEAFCNQSLYLLLERTAQVEHSRYAFEESCCHWSLNQAHVAAGASYSLRQYQRGGNRRRSETHVLMQGREARAELVGAARVNAGTHLDQQVIVEHRSPGAVSRQRFHGLSAGKGSSTFNGRIHIHERAPGSDAALTNRNLALHPEARINTKPELEIYTDDVRCAHGATVGKLSEESIFYLRSRGLSADEARLMLCRAFLDECIDGPFAAQAHQVLLDDLVLMHDAGAGS